MMTSTVRIEEADKDRLKRLQAAWKRLKGEAPSQTKLLGHVLAYLEDHEDDFLAHSAWRPLTDEQKRRWRERVRDLGGWPATPVEEIDAVVYGEEAYEEMMGRRERHHP